jgi:GTPase SAR1 family protein
MPFAISPDVARAGATVASTAWTHRNAVRGYVDKIAHLFKEGGRANIVVFGAGGVGKTRLAERLKGATASDSPSPPYATDVTPKTVKWSDHFGTIQIVPGQAHRHDFWDKQLQTVYKKKGIINVVSWGMHTPEEASYKGHYLYKQGMSIDDFLDVYMPHCRELEVDFVKKLGPHLVAISEPFWMLTVVNKQDLWWKQLSAVENHYLNGAYGAFISKTRNDAIRKFQHEFVSVAIELENWTTKEGEVLREVAPGYDTRARLANLKNLKNVIQELLGKH